MTELIFLNSSFPDGIQNYDLYGQIVLIEISVIYNQVHIFNVAT